MSKTTRAGRMLRSLGLSVLCALLFGSLASPTLAQPNECDIISRSASGPNAAAIQADVDAFRAELGEERDGVDSYPTGRREITWEQLSPSALAPAQLQGRIGSLVLSSTARNELFQVSADPGGFTPPRFGHIDPIYPTIFQTFSAERLFTPLGSNMLSIAFLVPGSSKPATVRQFGAIFVDVDPGVPPNTHIAFYGIDGTHLGTVPVPPFSNGLSFAAGRAPCQPIGRVKIQLGTAAIDAGTPEGDVVVLDNLIYSEPRRLLSETLDFDGDNKTDFAIYRPTNGGWYVRNSRDETMEAAIWGLAGDIPVPADYDGDGRTDFAVYRPSTGEWLFLARESQTAPPSQVWGQAGDIPVPFDYDHDGKVDVAVWRASDGGFYIRPSSLPFGDYTAVYWGQPGDIPLMRK